jgi:hypothetical protein
VSNVAPRVVVLVLCLALPAALAAQARFDVVGRDRIPDVPGLDIVTVRDNVLGTCTTLFVTDSGAAGQNGSGVLSGGWPMVEDAAIARDARLAELSLAFEAASRPLAAGVPGPNPLEYAWEAQKANTEFMVVAMNQAIARLEARLDRMAQAMQTVASAPGPCPAAPTGPRD